MIASNIRFETISKLQGNKKFKDIPGIFQGQFHNFKDFKDCWNHVGCIEKFSAYYY